MTEDEPDHLRVCPACERPLHPLLQTPGEYVHICGANFTLNPDGTVEAKP